jgi:hypothetical protein
MGELSKYQWIAPGEGAINIVDDLPGEGNAANWRGDTLFGRYGFRCFYNN